MSCHVNTFDRIAVMRWIRQRRQELSITQEELAARLQVRGQGYTRASVANWEQGRHSPPLDDSLFVQALADALQLDVPTVLHLSGFAVTSKHNPTSERLAAIADRLSDKHRNWLLKMAEMMLEE